MFSVRFLYDCLSSPPKGGSPVIGGGIGGALLKGPKGDKGDPGDSGGEMALLSYPAGQSISSGRAVIKNAGKVYYFDPTNSAHIGRIIGITTVAGLTDQMITVQTGGILQDAGFSFTIDSRVYVGANGVLTTTTPTAAGTLQFAGVSLSSNSLEINLLLPIIKI